MKVCPVHINCKKLLIHLTTFLCLVGIYPFLSGCASPPKPTQQNALKVFEEKCKNLAGTKIYKKIENVDGILLLKIRPKFTNNESVTKDRFLPHAAFIDEFGGDYYISTFLRNEVPITSEPISPNSRGHIVPLVTPKARREKKDHPGYKFVDYIDPIDGRHYRYTESIEVTGHADLTHPNVKRILKENPSYDINIYGPILKKTETQTPLPRYAVTYEDHVIPEDRALGIASSTIKVIDTATGELLAEYTNYSIGSGFENKYSTGSWLNAYSCPSNYMDSHARTRQFVDQVLIPSK